MSELWFPAGMKDPEHKLAWAASDLLENQTVPVCPLCKADTLRFYYHEFGIVKLARRRGTIWIWCDGCKVWEHISGVEAKKEFVYPDPLTTEEFKRIDTPFIVVKLNEYWDKGVLPKALAR